MSRPRFRDLGFTIGQEPIGRYNAITDVPGVRVGHVTIVEDEPRVIRTGVTAICPLDAEYWDEVVFAGTHSFNGFGELTGVHWIRESGILSSPVCIGSTFSIGAIRDALLAHPILNGWNDRFHQPVVGETNDGLLNDGLASRITAEDVYRALKRAGSGPVGEGNVGGGTGMVCHEFKGGIGTSSRLVETRSGRFAVGVLVQANYGLRGHLAIGGVPVGQRIGYDAIPGTKSGQEGSIIIVVATDAPLIPPQCTRLAQRAVQGLGRTGGYGANTSGDLILAFSTGNRIPARPEEIVPGIRMLPNRDMTPLFKATVEATEESIVNALVAAETMTGFREVTVHALPIDALVEILREHGR